ncbi:MAG TPA: hypothetical protein VHD76_18880 [Bryobacteraceae bacterium]|nr:hypothetical protein [Bryobacteraceae bacterium]
MNSENFLQAALEGLQLQKQRLDEQIAQVRSLLGQRKPVSAASSATTATSGAPRQRRELSAAARKRIAAAQRKRWAAYRKKAGAAGKSE